MDQKIMEYNINKEWFFLWMKVHWKHYIGSPHDKSEMIRMFEDEVCPTGRMEFTLPPEATLSGKEEAYSDFERVWFQTVDEGGPDYVFVHGYIG